MKVSVRPSSDSSFATNSSPSAIARLGVYQLGLSAVEYMPLLKFALGADTLADSAVIIVLDWTRPWEFLETFQRWINVLQHRMDEICKEGSAGESWSRGKAVVDDLREKGKRMGPLNQGSIRLMSVSSGALSADLHRARACKHIQQHGGVHIHRIRAFNSHYICHSISHYHHVCRSSYLALDTGHFDQ